jgi:hypothetical protein
MCYHHGQKNAGFQIEFFGARVEVGERVEGPGNCDAEAQPRRRNLFGVPPARQCGGA